MYNAPFWDIQFWKVAYLDLESWISSQSKSKEMTSFGRSHRIHILPFGTSLPRFYRDTDDKFAITTTPCNASGSIARFIREAVIYVA